MKVIKKNITKLYTTKFFSQQIFESIYVCDDERMGQPPYVYVVLSSETTSSIYNVFSNSSSVVRHMLNKKRRIIISKSIIIFEIMKINHET
jgi:hypothetical protein